MLWKEFHLLFSLNQGDDLHAWFDSLIAEIHLCNCLDNTEA